MTIRREHPAFSRTLISIPIIHTPEDMGAFSPAIAQATLRKLGRPGLQRKLRAVAEAWQEIEAAIRSLDLDYSKVRLYQDGLPVCGREPEIVAAMARAGSRNHLLLQELLSKGATLMGTESGDLLQEEYQLAQESLKPTTRAAVLARRRVRGEDLLKRRDRFIGQRLNETLQPGETGLLFLGMLHAVEQYLAPDIQVIYPLRRHSGFRR
jgi:hypothetical protein